MEPESTSERTPPPAPVPSDSASASVLRAPSESHEEPRNEEDRPKNRMIGGIVLGTLALLVGIVVVVNQIFRSVFNHEVSSKQLEHQSSELRELRAEEQAKLSRYQWVSRKDGVVRIPLDRARELTLAAYQRRAAKPSTGADEPRPPTGTR